MSLALVAEKEFLPRQVFLPPAMTHFGEVLANFVEFRREKGTRWEPATSEGNYGDEFVADARQTKITNSN